MNESVLVAAVELAGGGSQGESGVGEDGRERQLRSLVARGAAAAELVEELHVVLQVHHRQPSSPSSTMAINDDNGNSKGGSIFTYKIVS